VHEWTVGSGDHLRATSDLYWAVGSRRVHVQRGPCLQLGWEHMRKRIDPSYLPAR
jgi:hypothetical protein